MDLTEMWSEGVDRIPSSLSEVGWGSILTSDEQHVNLCVTLFIYLFICLFTLTI